MKLFYILVALQGILGLHERPAGVKHQPYTGEEYGAESMGIATDGWSKPIENIVFAPFGDKEDMIAIEDREGSNTVFFRKRGLRRIDDLLEVFGTIPREPAESIPLSVLVGYFKWDELYGVPTYKVHERAACRLRQYSWSKTRGYKTPHLHMRCTRDGLAYTTADGVMKYHEYNFLIYLDSSVHREPLAGEVTYIDIPHMGCAGRSSTQKFELSPYGEEVFQFSDGVSSGYALFKNVQKILSIAEDVRSFEHMSREGVLENGQKKHPGVDSSFDRTKDGVYLTIDRYPQYLSTPWGHVRIYESGMWSNGSSFIDRVHGEFFKRVKLSFDGTRYCEDYGEAVRFYYTHPTTYKSIEIPEAFVTHLKMTDAIVTSNYFGCISRYKVVAVDGERVSLVQDLPKYPKPYVLGRAMKWREEVLSAENCASQEWDAFMERYIKEAQR